MRILRLRLEACSLRQNRPEAETADPVEAFLGRSGRDPFLDEAKTAESEQNAARLAEIEDEIVNAENHIEDLESRHKEQPDSNRARLLRDITGMSTIAWDILLCCFAYEMDHRFRHMFAHIMDDPRLDYPCLQLFHRLPADSLEERSRVNETCLEESTLFKSRMLRFDRSSPDALGLGRRPVLIDEHIIHYLLGGNRLDGATEDMLQYPNDLDYDRTQDYDWSLAAPAIQETIRNDRPVLLHFLGPAGADTVETADAFAEYCGFEFLHIDAGRLGQIDQSSIAIVLEHCARECSLRRCGILLANTEHLRLPNGELDTVGIILLELAERYGLVCALTGRERIEMNLTPALLRGYHEISVRPPSFQDRARILRACVDEIPDIKNLDLDSIASNFRLSARALREAVHFARLHAAQEKGANAPVEQNDLLFGCRTRADKKLAETAARIESKFGWDDLVLASKAKTLLREACMQMKYGDMVFEKWGFAAKSTAKPGLHMLFAGPPGTGKTMAASVMAREMGISMYRVDIAATVSKYIGETEKNLARIFDAAESANAILFFDEADALFGRRGEISSSNDRYANIEVGYLLQRIEEYEGIAILATNLAENLDAAFLRRLHYVVEFSMPDREERRKMWEIAFPANAPIAPDLDFEYLAEHLDISGGNIKNIARQSGFFAADEARNGTATIRMPHIIRAVRREYEKEGKSLVTANLGPYSDLP